MQIIIYYFPLTVRFQTSGWFTKFDGYCGQRTAKLRAYLDRVSPKVFPRTQPTESYYVKEVTSFDNGETEVWTIDFWRDYK